MKINSCNYSIIRTIKFKRLNKFFSVFCILFLSIYSQSLFAQTSMVLKGQLEYEVNTNDIWGYSDDSGNEYALVGLQTGFSIVDVTDPANPEELFYIEGPEGVWRDIKTAYDHAYVVNEEEQGMLIVDLSELPDTIYHSRFTADSLLSTAHNIYIDENNIAYLAGYNNIAGDVPGNERGLLMFDLNDDPKNPTYIGSYNDAYVHDVYVKDDIAYTSEIYEGHFRILDVSDKANPVILGQHTTPSNFTHNAWLSEDGNFLFTTDEVQDAYIGAYDISDYSQIFETHRFQSSPGEAIIPHNVHVKDEFLVISYYTDGLVVVDASQKDLMIPVEKYDTSPQGGGSYAGCWGAYPFLPSGNILATDRQEGLFIIEAAYKRASYLRGSVADSETGATLNNVEVRVLWSEQKVFTDIFGNYKTGYHSLPNEKRIRFSKAGYKTKIVEGIVFDETQTQFLNVLLEPVEPLSLSISILDSESLEALDNVEIEMFDENNYYQSNTGDLAQAIINDILPNNYSLIIGKWGYQTQLLNAVEVQGETLVLKLDKGYFDDFFFDFGWNAQDGLWDWADPIGTQADSLDFSFCNPEFDFSLDLGNHCYVTKNLGNEYEQDDIDNETATLESPAMDLSAIDDPYLSFFSWYCSANEEGTNGAFEIYLKNEMEEVFVANLPIGSDWVFNSIKISDYISPTSTTSVVFKLSDDDNGSGNDRISEAGLDFFQVTDSAIVDPTYYDPTIGLNQAVNQSMNPFKISSFPNPFHDENTLSFEIPNESIELNNWLTVFDSKGKKVFQAKLNHGQKSFKWGENLEPGLYFINLSNENFTQNIKAIKVR